MEQPALVGLAMLVPVTAKCAKTLSIFQPRMGRPVPEVRHSPEPVTAKSGTEWSLIRNDRLYSQRPEYLVGQL